MILGYAREFTDSPWGGIGLYRPAENQIEVKAIYGYEQQLESFPVDAGITGRAIRTKQAVNLGDISQDSNYIVLSAD